MNSTIAELHDVNPDDPAFGHFVSPRTNEHGWTPPPLFGHFGYCGETQWRWFQERLKSYQQRGWLRIGVVHHNVRPHVVNDEERLHDVEDLNKYLAPHLNLLLHGHTHEGKQDRLPNGVLVLSTGSASMVTTARPPGVANQYQFLRVWPDKIERWTRGYDVGQHRWVADSRSSDNGNDWITSHAVVLTDVAATFPAASAARTGVRPASVDADEPGDSEEWATSQSRGRDDWTEIRPLAIPRFLSDVAEVCSLREQAERVIPVNGPLPYLRVTRQTPPYETFPVGASDGDITPALLQQFLSEVDALFRPADRQLVAWLVHNGRPATKELIGEASRAGVRLQSIVEYRQLIDFRDYLTRQTGQLERDPVYPPAVYVSQRAELESPRQPGPRLADNAERAVFDCLGERDACFVLVLGDFGTGKTFLLHELARRMPVELPFLTPVLMEMRSLEKAQTLRQLVASHLAKEQVRQIDLDAFDHMLRAGQIALLFDGFDELALRISYDRAMQHFETLEEAAKGYAKIVVTSRTQHFVSDAQVKKRLMERAELIPGYRLVRLQPFEPAQIRQYLVNRATSTGLDAAAKVAAEDRYRRIDHVKEPLGLSHNPRMLSFIADLPDSELEAAKRGQGEITAASLYERLLTWWLNREIDRREFKGIDPGLSFKASWRAMTSLALRLWGQTERSVSVTDLTDEAARALQGLGETKLDHAVATHHLGSGTLLVRDADGQFPFVHQSVMEWLVANDAAARLNESAPCAALGQREFSPLTDDWPIRDEFTIELRPKP